MKNKRVKKLFLYLSLVGIIILKLVFSIIGIKNRGHTNKNKRILVLSYFNLGDIICDTASFRALKLNWPDSYIHVLVRKSEGIELLKLCPYVDQVDTIVSQLDDLSLYLKQLNNLSKLNFTHSIQLVRHFDQVRKSHIPYILGIKERYGILDRDYEKVFKKCFTKYIYTGKRRSRREESLEIVKLTGAKLYNRNTECWIDYDCDLRIKKMIYKKKDNREIIIIHPGATLKIKQWPIEYYANLINRVNALNKYRIILTGVKSEDADLKQILTLCDKQLELYSNLQLFEYISLLNLSKIVITNDTGPLHFCIALEKAVIAVFGPTPPDYAIGRDIPESCIVLRSETKCPNNKICSVFSNMSKEERILVKDLCSNNYRVCTKSIPVELVELMFMQLEKYIDSNGKDKITPTNNIQYYNNITYRQSLTF